MIRTQRRVLLVDGDPMVRRVLSRMLRARYEVVDAGGVADVARILALDTGTLEAAVVDYELDDGDGFDVQRLLVAQRPELDGRTILFTGSHLDPALRRRASEALMRLIPK